MTRESGSVVLSSLGDELGAMYDNLAQVVQAVPGALVVFDEAGTITQINPESSELLQVPHEELLWGNVAQFLGPQHPAVLELFDRLRGRPRQGAGSTLRTEERWRNSKGQLIPVLLSARLMGEKNSSVVCIVSNLTEQKRLELELLHAQKLEAMGQVATGVVHEISAPIQYMGDSVHFLEKALDDLVGEAPLDENPSEEERALTMLLREMQDSVSAVQDGLERVGEIVSAVRGFSKQQRAGAESVVLRSLVDGTLVVARSHYKYVAKTHVTCDPSLRVMCRPGDLRQILLALVINASQSLTSAHPKGGGVLTLFAHKESDAVVIEVSDNGLGIEVNVARNIFDPFFTTKADGTGQGLAISRHLARANGGEIAVESQLGAGACFRVTLPCESVRQSGS